MTIKSAPTSLDAGIAWLQGSVGEPVPERLAFIAEMRAMLLQRRHDPLAQAEVSLLEALVFDTSRSARGIVEDLTRALQVFEVNDRRDRVALCWRLLAGWHKMRGATAESLACAQRALGMPELKLEARLGLANVVLPGLSALLCFEEAGISLARDFMPFMVSTQQPSRALAFAWTDVAYHHVLRAMRAGRVRSLFTLDQQDAVAQTGPEEQALMKPELDRALASLQQARALGHAAIEPAVRLTQGLVLALSGRHDDAARCFGASSQAGLSEATRLQNLGWAARVNGRWQEALVHLQQGAALARELDLAMLERACCHEIAVCSQALRDFETCSAAQQRFIVLQAGMSVQGQRLDARPDLWREPLLKAIEKLPSTAAVTGAQKSQWRRAVPPYVKRAMRLIETTIQQRLSLAEVAEQVGARPRTLQAGLRQYYGASFVAADRSAAMTEANRLLQWSPMPIAEVAKRVGYGSSATFSRDYRTVYGVTPTTFRASAD